MSALPANYLTRLSVTHVLGLVGAFAWWPLNRLPFLFHEAWVVQLPLLALAPVPAIAAATLLIRDFGWRLGLCGAPAAIIATVTPGAWHVVAIALAPVEGG